MTGYKKDGPTVAYNHCVYDERGNLLEMEHDPFIYDWKVKYSYDDRNNITAEDTYFGPTNDFVGGKFFKYDGSDRLIESYEKARYNKTDKTGKITGRDTVVTNKTTIIGHNKFGAVTEGKFIAYDIGDSTLFSAKYDSLGNKLESRSQHYGQNDTTFYLTQWTDKGKNFKKYAKTSYTSWKYCLREEKKYDANGNYEQIKYDWDGKIEEKNVHSITKNFETLDTYKGVALRHEESDEIKYDKHHNIIYYLTKQYFNNDNKTPDMNHPDRVSLIVNKIEYR